MKHAVIFAHPKPRSLTHSVAAAYVQSVEALGQTAIVRDLYGIGFDPCLKAGEIPTAAGYQFGADVMDEREQLTDVDVFAFIYPFWFNGPPAILKGYVDRVFSMGFGYQPALGGTESLLDGKKLISFTTSGAPGEWVQETGAMMALLAIFDRHVGAVCGLQVLDHVHAGSIVSDITPEAAEEVLLGARRAVGAYFGDPAIANPSGLRTGT